MKHSFLLSYEIHYGSSQPISTYDTKEEGLAVMKEFVDNDKDSASFVEKDLGEDHFEYEGRGISYVLTKIPNGLKRSEYDSYMKRE